MLVYQRVIFELSNKRYIYIYTYIYIHIYISYKLSVKFWRSLIWETTFVCFQGIPAEFPFGPVWDCHGNVGSQIEYKTTYIRWIAPNLGYKPLPKMTCINKNHAIITTNNTVFFILHIIMAKLSFDTSRKKGTPKWTQNQQRQGYKPNDWVDMQRCHLNKTIDQLDHCVYKVILWLKVHPPTKYAAPCLVGWVLPLPPVGIEHSPADLRLVQTWPIWKMGCWKWCFPKLKLD